MRTLSTLAVVAFAAAAMAADPLRTMSFQDGQDRTLASFAGQTLVVVPLNGKC